MDRIEPAEAGQIGEALAGQPGPAGILPQRAVRPGDPDCQRADLDQGAVAGRLGLPRGHVAQQHQHAGDGAAAAAHRRDLGIPQPRRNFHGIGRGIGAERQGDRLGPAGLPGAVHPVERGQAGLAERREGLGQAVVDQRRLRSAGGGEEGGVHVADTVRRALQHRDRHRRGAGEAADAVDIGQSGPAVIGHGRSPPGSGIPSGNH